LLMNMDILGVRGLGHGPSSAVGAGYYQAAAVLARAPVLVGLAVLGAGFPFLARDAADRENERKLVRMMVRVLALGPLPIAIVLAAAPHAAISFFFPASYAPAIGLLRLTAIAAFPLIALALVVTCLQALDSMKRASAAIVPAVILEAVLLVILVPRDGAIGAAWAALLAATLSAVVALLLAPRRWAAPVLSQLAPLAGGWAVLAFVTSVWQVPAHFWIPSAILLYAMFLLVVWALGGLSLAELVSIAPPFMREPMAGLARHESGWRSR
jgi:O-antigen/teichoic acid export membrane protein